MYYKSHELFTAANPTSTLGKIIQFPLVRMVIVFLFFVPLFRLHTIFVKAVITPSPEPYHTLLFYFDAILSFVVFLFVYSLFTKYIEKRKAYEISGKHVFREFGSGFGISMGLIAILVLMLAVLGYYEVESFNSSLLIIIYSFFLFGMKAFIEELIFRLIIFRLLEEFLGSWISLIILSVIFGFVHLGNPNSSIWSSLAIVIIGGLFESAAYMYTRRIWFALGIHMGWNYFQAGIFGMPSSGIEHESLINSVVIGPELITGGSFGIELSLVAIILCLIVGLFILKKAIDRNQIVSPIWKRGIGSSKGHI